MAKLLATRSGVLELETKLTYSLKEKLSKMVAISSSDLVLLYETLKEVSLPVAAHNEILTQLDLLAVHSTCGQSGVKLALTGQECKTFHRYLTINDIDTLQKCSMWEGCSILSKRMKQLGICGMKESLKKHALGVLVWFENQRTHKIPAAEAIYALGHALCTSLHNEVLPVPEKALRLASYPEDPFFLEVSHLEASYGLERPEKKEFEGLALIMQRHCWVRNTATALTKEPCKPSKEPSQQVTLQTSDQSAFSSSLSDKLLLQLVSKFDQVASGIMQKPVATDRTSSFESLGTPGTLPVLQNQVLEPKVVNQANDLPKVKEPVPKTLEEYEEENKAALEKRDSKKKKEKATGTPAAKQAMKRPASCKAYPKQKKAKEDDKENTLGKGCLRCRGNRNGCDTCNKSGFKGLKLTRAEWNQHAKLHNLK